MSEYRVPIVELRRCQACGFTHEVGPCPAWTQWDDEEEGFYMEPDLSFQDEFDSQMVSIGWGMDEDYGYAGDEPPF